jgi:RNA polymerase subunit RPABC4/transcription elongation factor Spt4
MGFLTGEWFGTMIIIAFLIAIVAIFLPPLLSYAAKASGYRRNIPIIMTRGQENYFIKIFQFDSYVAPQAIKLYYYYGLVFIIVTAVVVAITILPQIDQMHSVFLLLTILIYGVLFLGMAIFGWRFTCEWMLMQFQLYDRVDTLGGLIEHQIARHDTPVAPPPAVKACGRCGAELSPDARFCTECGTASGGAHG